MPISASLCNQVELQLCLLLLSLNLRLRAVLTHPNWSSLCDSRVIGSVSRCQHSDCNCATAVKWKLAAQHLCKSTCRRENCEKLRAVIAFLRTGRKFLPLAKRHLMCQFFRRYKKWQCFLSPRGSKTFSNWQRLNSHLVQVIKYKIRLLCGFTLTAPVLKVQMLQRGAYAAQLRKLETGEQIKLQLCLKEN